MTNNGHLLSPDLQGWFRENAPRFHGTLSFDERLSKHTYYRIGGNAAVFAIPRDRNDLQWLAEGIRETQVPYFVLGQGSNLLVSDTGFPGVIIKAGRLNLEISLVNPPQGTGCVEASSESSRLRLRTGASVAISTLLRKAAQEGWAGLEFLTGIPGSIGGVVTMNAGTHLGEVEGSLRSVEVYSVLDSEAAGPTIFNTSELRFQYRKNLFLPKGCAVWAAEWQVQKKDPAEVKASIDEILARRKATQPIEYPSCGSIFKNPKEAGLHAWQVIDRLGLRNHQIGAAKFSEKHSNFILNLGNATAADVRALVELAKDRAQKEMGIALEEEVIYLGF